MALKRPGAQKKYTAASLRKAVVSYIAARSYEEPVMIKTPMTDSKGKLILDEYGHTAYTMKPVVTRAGKEAVRIVWISQINITDLCLELGIDKSTWARYAAGTLTEDPEENREILERKAICQWAKDQVEAYMQQKLEDGKASRGVMFALEQNFGWGKEAGQAGAEEAVITMEERERILQELQQLRVEHG